MRKLVFVLFLLTLPFSIFAQSQPSDSLIQKYRKEVRKFMKQAGFNGSIFYNRHLNKKVSTDKNNQWLIWFVSQTDSSIYYGDQNFILLPRIVFRDSVWNKELVKKVILHDVPRGDTAQNFFYNSFDLLDPIWSYDAPIFSPDWKWCVFSYNYIYWKDCFKFRIAIYKKSWRGWHRYKTIKMVSNKHSKG